MTSIYEPPDKLICSEHAQEEPCQHRDHRPHDDPADHQDGEQLDEQAKVVARRKLADKKGTALADEAEAALRTFKAISADTIDPEDTDWAWRPYGDEGMPVGELVVLVGKGGAAKSTILCWFTARITRGELEGDWKGPGKVLFLYREDSREKTIIPRLIAANADLSMVVFMEVSYLNEVDDGGISLPRDCEALVQFIRDNDIVAVMYDPLSSHLSAKDSNAQLEMRRIYERLRKVHEVTNTLGIGLGHTRKAVAGNLIDAFMGSSEQGNVVRCAWGAIKQPQADNEYVLSQEKNNLGPTAGSLKYTIVNEYVTDRRIKTSRIEFTGRSDETVSDILSDQMKPGGGTTQKAKARTWLETYLAGGEVEVSKLKADGEEAGHNYRTLQRAAGGLGVEFETHGLPGASHNTWRLP